MDGQHASATLGERYHVDVVAGGHRYPVDCPRPVGDASGARPGELLVGALVACKAQAVREFCQSQRIELRACTVDAEYRPSPDPHTGQRRMAFAVNITLDADLTPEQLGRLSAYVDDESGVDQLLRRAAPIHTVIRVR